MTRALLIVMSLQFSACGGRIVPDAGGIDAADVADGHADEPDGIDAPLACLPTPPDYLPPAGPSAAACGVPCGSCTCGRVPCGTLCCPYPGMWCDLSQELPTCRAVVTPDTQGSGASSGCDTVLAEGRWYPVNPYLGGSGPWFYPDWNADSGIPGCAVCRMYHSSRPPATCGDGG